ncbi:MAG: DUF2341 domain-containing protein [Petrotogales bacterium]
MKLVISLAVVILALVGTVSALAISNSGGGDWEYYKEIKIKENSGEALEDYQVLVELDSTNFDFSKAKSDGSDVRFKANEEELSYWIEEWNEGAKNAKIWVKVPSIPANDETKIKMYYGNPTATSVSNGNATFEFFDDFEGNEYDSRKWDFYSMHGTSPASGGSVSVQGGYAELDAPNDRTAELRTKSIFKRNIAIEYQIISTGKQSDGSGALGCSYGDNYRKNCYKFDLEHKSYKSFCIRKHTGTQDRKHSDVLNKDSSFSLQNKMGRMHFVAKITQEELISECNINGKTYSLQATDNDFSDKKVSLFSGEVKDVLIDYVLIRNYVSPHPIISFSAEKLVAPLTLSKTISPHSIKQGQESTVTITVENTADSLISDIEVKDSLSDDFPHIDGQTSAAYDELKSGETRTFQYKIKSTQLGKFSLPQATAMYADKEGNYHETESNTPVVEVVASLDVSPTPATSIEIPTFAYAIIGLVVVVGLVVYIFRERIF